MDKGWILIHRKIRDCDLIWDDKPFSRGQAWIDLLLMVNHEDKEIMFNGNYTKIERGQTLTSLTKLGERWGWSRKKTTKFLNELKMAQMVDVESNNKRTVVTVINYDFYQNVGTTKEPQKHRRGTAEEPQRNTNNKLINNDKELNKESRASDEATSSKKFIPPTEEEVEAYCRERGNDVNASKFVNFYAAKGWMIGKNKMKDWKRAVLTWENRSGQNSPPKDKPQWQ